jgi:hypothetical protein
MASPIRYFCLKKKPVPQESVTLVLLDGSPNHGNIHIILQATPPQDVTIFICCPPQPMKLLREVAEKSRQHIIVNGDFFGHDGTKCTEVSMELNFVVLNSTELPHM